MLLPCLLPPSYGNAWVSMSICGFYDPSRKRNAGHGQQHTHFHGTSVSFQFDSKNVHLFSTSLQTVQADDLIFI